MNNARTSRSPRGWPGRVIGWWLAVGLTAMLAPPVMAGPQEEQVAQTFLNAERDLWELESRLLHEALDAVSRSDSRSTTEMGNRRLIRESRNPQTLRKVRDYVDRYLDDPTHRMVEEIADVNGMRPEDIFADYLTVEATIDFALMAAAYNTVHGNNLDKFPTDARRMLKQLVDPLRKAPLPSNDIEVGRVGGSRLVVSVFGCDITEEVENVVADRRAATLTWRSNYSFLRDLSERKPPRETREEQMTNTNGRWTINFVLELEDFIASGGRSEWGRKVRELANIDNYLERRDPLDEGKSRRSRYVYDPDNDERVAGKFDPDRDNVRGNDRPGDRSTDRSRDNRSERRFD